MSSARGALSVVGQVAGAYVTGSPYGAALGGYLGGELGGVIDGPQQFFGQKQDIRAPQITFGGVIPRIYGTFPVAGFLAYCSDKFEVAHTEEQGGKGGPTAETTTFTYKVNCIFLLAERTEEDCGQPKAITRVWRNGELIWTALDESGTASIDASQATSAWESFTFLDGNPDQEPWPIYEAAVGTDAAMAYRWRAGVAIEGLDLGQAGQLPLLEFEVITAGTGFGGGRRIDLRFATDGTDSSVYNATPTLHGDPVMNEFLEVRNTNEECYVSYTGTQLGYMPVGQAWRMHCKVNWSSLPNITNNVIWNWFRDPASGGNHYVLQWYASSGLLRLDGNATIIGPVLSAFTDYTIDVEHDGASTLTLKVNGNVVGTATVTDGRSTVTEGLLRVGGEFYSLGNGDRYYMIDDVYLTYGGGITPGTVDLADVVKSEWLRCGTLTEDTIDVSDLVGVPVRGVAATGPASEITARLAAAYYFDVFCNDKLRAVRRGGATVASIPFLDTGVAEGQPGEPFTGLTRENEIEQPAQVTVTYMDVDSDYEPCTESSDRLVTPSSEVRQLTIGVVMSAAEAKGRAKTWALDARAAANSGKTTVSDRYARLDCADPIVIADHEGTQYRVRIVRTNDAGGIRTVELCLDDVSALHETAVTSANYTPAVTLQPTGETTLVVGDWPLLRDTDDTTGLYVAAKIEGKGKASVVYKSADGTTYSSVATVAEEAVIGEAQDVLGDWSGATFDERNSVTVDVGDGTLSSSTRDALLADASINAFALGSDRRWEIGQFRAATLVSPGVYRLTGLLRGRKGTEWATASHEVGDTFVLLNGLGVRRATLINSELGHVLYWKGVTQGRPVNTAEARQLACWGVSQRPWSPVDLRAASDGNTGDALLSWTRRTRAESRFGGVYGSYFPLAEVREEYQVRIYSDASFTTLVRFYLSSSPALTYPAAQQVADLGGVVLPADLSWGVCQVSERVGLGYEALSNGTSRMFPTS